MILCAKDILQALNFLTQTLSIMKIQKNSFFCNTSELNFYMNAYVRNSNSFINSYPLGMLNGLKKIVGSKVNGESTQCAITHTPDLLLTPHVQRSARKRRAENDNFSSKKK